VAGFYANITVQSPEQAAVVDFLNDRGWVAYVSPTVRTATVVYHEDLGRQEELAAKLSLHFRCPALLVMDYGGSILLYQLYRDGRQIDAYVSSPHDELEMGSDAAPEGDPAVLCEAFGTDHLVSRVERILNKPTRENGEYALAVNRHGELARALALPLFAAGTGYQAIEIGELPEGTGFNPGQMVKTGQE
jgi:hypothetical protein